MNSTSEQVLNGRLNQPWREGQQRHVWLQGAFELIVMQCPMAVAGLLSGMGRRLAAASAIRNHRSKYDPTGRAAVATPVPVASSKSNGAAGGGTSKRGEVVTIALIPAGESCEVMIVAAQSFKSASVF